MHDAATALLALWNDVDPAFDAEYNDWHANEHVPERLTVPGMLWGRRCGLRQDAAMPRYLTLYGLRSAEVLDSEPYGRLLNHPTPMSRAMRPRLRHLSRWVCKLHEQTDLDRSEWLAVQTRDSEPDAGSGRLLAQRLPEARPLPWLQATQDRTIEGRWLVCVPLDAGAGPERSAAAVTVYSRLPVGLRMH